MRILILPSWYPTEDQPISGIFFKEQAQALIKAGHEVYVFYQQMHSLRTIGKNKNIGLKYRVEDNVPTYRFEGYTYIPRSHKAYEYIQKIRLRKFTKMLEKKHGKIDLVHAHSFVWGGITAAALCKHSGIPLIITEHSTEFSRGLIKSYMKPLITKASQVAHKVIVVGPGLKEELCNYMDEDKLVIIPNIVNINNFDVVPQQTNVVSLLFSLCAF
jgi:glycosyltransferase involved in cell wall biosynthesis